MQRPADAECVRGRDSFDEERATNDAFIHFPRLWENWLELATWKRLSESETTGIDWRTADGTKDDCIWATVPSTTLPSQYDFGVLLAISPVTVYEAIIINRALQRNNMGTYRGLPFRSWAATPRTRAPRAATQLHRTSCRTCRPTSMGEDILQKIVALRDVIAKRLLRSSRRSFLRRQRMFRMTSRSGLVRLHCNIERAAMTLRSRRNRGLQVQTPAPHRMRMRTSKIVHVAGTASGTKIAVTFPGPVPGPGRGPDLGLVPGSRPRFAGAGNRGWPRFPICRESGTGPRPDSHRGVTSLQPDRDSEVRSGPSQVCYSAEGPEVYQWDSGHNSQVDHRRKISAVTVNSEGHLGELRAGRRSAAPGHSGLSRQRLGGPRSMCRGMLRVEVQVANLKGVL